MAPERQALLRAGPAPVGVAGDRTLLVGPAPEAVVLQVVRGEVDPLPGTEHDRVAENVRSGVLLTGDDQRVAVAVDRLLAEAVLWSDVHVPGQPHLQQVGHVDILGLHPGGDGRIKPRMRSRNVQVVVRAVPAGGGQVDPAYQLQAKALGRAGDYLDLRPGDLVLDALERRDAVTSRRKVRHGRSVAVELARVRERVVDRTRSSSQRLEARDRRHPVVERKLPAVSEHGKRVVGDDRRAGRVAQLDPCRRGFARRVDDRQLENAGRAAADESQAQQDGKRDMPHTARH